MNTDTAMSSEAAAAAALGNLYRRYGYVPFRMSRFEEYDLYLRNKDFLQSDRIITFSGPNGRLLALKPDVTLSIVKNAPDTPGVIQKVYYQENVYRDYREILQTGLECVGDLADYEIAEVVMLAAKSLLLFRRRCVLGISHMGLVAAMLEACGFDEEEKQQAMTCLRHKNPHGLQALCRDRALVWEKLRVLTTSRGSGPEVLSQLRRVLTTPAEEAALAQLETLWQVLDQGGCTQTACLDFSVSSDLRYYSGVVFRGYVEGIPTGVLSGGQYDKLLRNMGRNSRAIGFAVYLDLLQALCRQPEGYDIDTVILHDGTVDTARLMAAAEAAGKTGRVLVTRQLPENRNYQKVVRLGKEGQEV